MKRAKHSPVKRPCLPAMPARIILGSLILAAWSASAAAQDVAGLSLEDLLNTDVSTVSRKTQRLSETAAAVFVITGDELHRSGATSIPDALRMVPGVQVARMGNARWAVTARGFNGRFANKLLVLMDGRSIYSPLFSGVIWEQEDTLLEDIDRIEVIRGPGAAMWGANAVNGVINIITKRARATQGGQATLAAGSEERPPGQHAGAVRSTIKAIIACGPRGCAAMPPTTRSKSIPAIPRGQDSGLTPGSIGGRGPPSRAKRIGCWLETVTTVRTPRPLRWEPVC